MSFKIELKDQQDIHDHWYVRCIMEALDGRHQVLFLVLCAMHRRVRDQFSPQLDAVFPRFGDACRINLEGVCYAKYQREAAGPIEAHLIGTTTQIEGALRRCADRVKLTDEQRKELFQSFNDWIEKDERAKSTEE